MSIENFEKVLLLVPSIAEGKPIALVVTADGDRFGSSCHACWPSRFVKTDSFVHLTDRRTLDFAGGE